MKKSIFKRWWFWVIVVIIFITVVANGGEPDDKTASGDLTPTPTEVANTSAPEPTIEPGPTAVAASTPTPEATPEATAVPTPEPTPEPVNFGEGTHIIGEDIQPGIYRNEGGVNYWARLSGFSGEISEVIANGSLQSGPLIVEILETDKGFESQGAGLWYLIDDSYIPKLLTEFGDGYYIVGKDIEPGTYRSDGAEYWARLKDFTGGIDSIIANGAFEEGSKIVQISSSDVGFTSSGAQWKKTE